MDGNTIVSIIGGLIILGLVVLAIFIRMKKNPSIYDKQAATEFLEGLSNIFYQKMMDIVGNIKFDKYSSIEEMEAAMKGMLAPKFKEAVQGHAEIRTTFKVSGVGTIAGCYVLDGKIVRNSEVRIVRDGVVVYEGLLDSLKRFKDDAKEVAAGYECGCAFNKFNDIKEGDVIESFIMEEIKS